jgi:signal peptidase I
MNDTEAAPVTAVPAPIEQKNEGGSFSWFLVKLAIVVLLLRSFVFAPFSIPSESMLPRLLIGDYLVVAKWPYGFSRYSIPFSPPLWSGRLFASQPERGDVVVFKAPPDQSQDYIKRVIGLPGDLIEVRGGVVFINGTAVPKRRIADFVEPLTMNSACRTADAAQFRERATDGGERCRYPRYVETLPNGRSYQVLDLGTVTADDTEVYSVPAGHVFLMGDNRDRSADSRFPAVEGAGIGIVPQDNLIGRAWFTVFSTDGGASWILPWTWFTAARWNRIGEGF